MRYSKIEHEIFKEERDLVIEFVVRNSHIFINSIEEFYNFNFEKDRLDYVKVCDFERHNI